MREYCLSVRKQQPDTQLFSHPQRVVALGVQAALLTNGMGMAFHAKSGKKIDPLDMDALVHDNARGEQGIEAPGNQGCCFVLCADDIAGSRLIRMAGSSANSCTVRLTS